MYDKSYNNRPNGKNDKIMIFYPKNRKKKRKYNILFTFYSKKIAFYKKEIDKINFV